MYLSQMATKKKIYKVKLAIEKMAEHENVSKSNKTLTAFKPTQNARHKDGSL